jgi:hypothetical protein
LAHIMQNASAGREKKKRQWLQSGASNRGGPTASLPSRLFTIVSDPSSPSCLNVDDCFAGIDYFSFAAENYGSLKRDSRLPEYIETYDRTQGRKFSWSRNRRGFKIYLIAPAVEKYYAKDSTQVFRLNWPISRRFESIPFWD